MTFFPGSDNVRPCSRKCHHDYHYNINVINYNQAKISDRLQITITRRLHLKTEQHVKFVAARLALPSISVVLCMHECKGDSPPPHSHTRQRS